MKWKQDTKKKKQDQHLTTNEKRSDSLKEVYKFLVKDLLKENDNIVIALSGGPDSMALLFLLKDVQKKKRINIICAHINHNVRKESKEEKIFVEKICKENNIIFEYRKIEKYPKDQFKEEIARQKRYEYFDEIANKYNAKYLFTAHHGDDLIETILMRIVRGSTLKGYSGFSKVTKRGQYQIIRPFIEITKEDILTYNRINKIPYVIDKSNEEDKYTRNRYRKYILPLLKKENKNIHHKFYKLSKTLNEYNSFIEKYTKEIFEKIYKDNILNIASLLKEETIIQKQIIHLFLEKIYKKDISKITDKHTEQIYKMIYTKKPNVKGNFPNHIEIRKTYNKLIWKKGKQEIKPYKLEIKDKIVLPNGHVIEKIKETKETNNFVCHLNTKEITLPLFVRTKIKGDKVSIKGMNGTKKIKDIFINEKIDLEERKTWPIVVDAKNKVVWIPGLKKTKLDNPKEEMYDIILKYY